MSHTSAESVTKTESVAGKPAAEETEQFFTLWTVFKRSADVTRTADAVAEFEALLTRGQIDERPVQSDQTGREYRIHQ